MNIDVTWRLSIDGHTWTAADLTAGELAQLVLLLGDRWETLSPLGSPVALMSHVAVHLATIRGIDVDSAVAAVQAMPVVDLLAAIVPDNPPPAKRSRRRTETAAAA